MEDDGTYKRERNLLSLLCENGSFAIDKTLFYKAYFENYDPSKTENQETGVPAWKDLWAEIGRSYCPGFLNKLDLYINNFGINQTIKDMSSREGIEKIKVFKKDK